MAQENTGDGPDSPRKPLEEPAEGARSQEKYDDSRSVTPLEEPAEGAPDDANAPPAADRA